MFKTLGVVLAGVFAGVVIVEILRSSSPDLLKNVEKKATDFVDSVKSSFNEGYEGAKS